MQWYTTLLCIREKKVNLNVVEMIRLEMEFDQWVLSVVLVQFSPEDI